MVTAWRCEKCDQGHGWEPTRCVRCGAPRVPMPSPEEIEQRLRDRAAAEGRRPDAVDAFLINMTRILGVETTDRFVGGDSG